MVEDTGGVFQLTMYQPTTLCSSESGSLLALQGQGSIFVLVTYDLCECGRAPQDHVSPACMVVGNSYAVGAPCTQLAGGRLVATKLKALERYIMCESR